MSYNTKANIAAHDITYTLERSDIKQKDDYSCIKCWKGNLINSRTNAKRFWRFYRITFKPTYQTNAVIRQAFTLLVSTVTKKTSVITDEEYTKHIALQLVESIQYKYEPPEGIKKTA